MAKKRLSRNSVGSSLSSGSARPSKQAEVPLSSIEFNADQLYDLVSLEQGNFDLVDAPDGRVLRVIQTSPDHPVHLPVGSLPESSTSRMVVSITCRLSTATNPASGLRVEWATAQETIRLSDELAMHTVSLILHAPSPAPKSVLIAGTDSGGAYVVQCIRLEMFAS